MELDLLVISIVLILSFSLSQLFRRYNYPDVVAQIASGFLLGIPVIKAIFFSKTDVVQVFSEIGIIFLLLLTGMEVNYKEILREKKEILYLSIFSFIVPFALGFLATLLLGYTYTTAIIIGFALSLTAEDTNIKLLMDYGLLNTKLGRVMIGAGIADDLFEIIGLSFVLFSTSGMSAAKLYLLPFELLIFVGIVYLVLKGLPRFTAHIKEASSEIESFTLVIILGLITAFLAQLLNIGTIIGAFVAGLLVHKLFHTAKEEKMTLKDLKIVTFGFIVPFFFVNIGLNFNYESLGSSIPTTIVIVAVAIAGKLLGSLAIRFFTKYTFRQTMLLGWAMNSRGAVELVIISLAKANGLIPDELFGSVVIMTIITTLIFPLVLKHYIYKYPHIMNEDPGKSGVIIPKGEEHIV